ncbi:MAG: spore coat protein CotJB [Oscillospiraceae bacterium]|nr:spore coat protein CotJB [Oscillospiraceae bacterium]
MQDSAAPAYEPSEALERGTLFPGLDLPFMNVVNENVPDVPTAELMAIDFVTDELELYLDTHAADREAFQLYQSFLALKEEAHRRYAEAYGPICQRDQLGSDAYTWLRDPWPWDYPVREER